MIQRGDIYWLTFQGRGSERSGRRPALVIQHDRFNRSAISATVVAAITANLRLAAMPGNLRLSKGEGNLPRACVINVTQLLTVDKARLSDRLGTLSAKRMLQVRAGLELVLGA